MRIPGFRHKWVDSIEADNQKGPPYFFNGASIKLVAYQKSKRIFRPKKTILIYQLGQRYYMADDQSDFRFIPIAPTSEMPLWERRFMHPTAADLDFLKLYNYTLVRQVS